MRVLVVSDIHANLNAFDAVLADAAGQYEQIWSLGDIVGYGPRPNECIALLMELDHLAIPGNHDYGVLGRISLDDFNPDARSADLWTRERLTEASRRYLEALPETVTADGFTLAHGSPRAPIWEYLLSARDAHESMAHFDTPVCLVGHTHVPVIFAAVKGGVAVLPPQPQAVIVLDDGRYIINPGSVGQPRDGDPEAAYMLVDTVERTFSHRRVPYDVAGTQAEMRAAGLPPRLVARLAFGW